MEVFERCYSRLYSELHSLNELYTPAEDDFSEYADWFDLIGPKPRTHL